MGRHSEVALVGMIVEEQESQGHTAADMTGTIAIAVVAEHVEASSMSLVLALVRIPTVQVFVTVELCTRQVQESGMVVAKTRTE